MTDLFDLHGKIAVVTGGSRGIGEMIAAGFVENGVRTYIVSRNADDCNATAERLSSAGDCVSLPADLSTTDGVHELAAEFGERENTLHILVNNAGATWGEPIDNFPEHGWDKVMAINLKAPFFLTRALLPRLEAAASDEDPARVINIGSIDGLHVNSRRSLTVRARRACIT